MESDEMGWDGRGMYEGRRDMLEEGRGNGRGRKAEAAAEAAGEGEGKRSIWRGEWG